MRKYKCLVCGYIYNPEVGDPDAAMKPGTSFEDLPEDWTCPICRVEKAQFAEADESEDEIKRPESAEAARNRKIDGETENVAPQNESRIEEVNNETDYDNAGDCACYDEEEPIDDK